jgi:hypothetical protein
VNKKGADEAPFFMRAHIEEPENIAPAGLFPEG